MNGIDGIIDPLVADDHHRHLAKELLTAANEIYYVMGMISIPRNHLYSPTDRQRLLYQERVTNALHVIASCTQNILMDFEPDED